MAFAALVVACGCKKEANKTILTGHVIEYGTSKPVAGAAVYVISQQGDPFGNPVYVTIDSFLTDAAGAFHREYLDKNLPGGEAVSVYKSGYRYEQDLPFHSGENNLEVVLKPYAWLKLRTIPDQGESTIGVSIDAVGYSFFIYSVEGDSSRVFEILGNRDVKITWFTYQPTQEYSATTYCPGGDTTYYELHF